MSHDKELTHIDLFSGIGGMSLASGWAGFRTVVFCEKDEFCQKVLHKHWPSVPIMPDIRDFRGRDYRGSTLLTGGFPCQPFSHCGKLRGKNDDRYLWPAMLEVIRDARPSWVVVENVSNLIKMAIETVVADLEKERYNCVVALLPAHGIGAPHRRRRTFVVAQSLDTDSDGVGLYRETLHPYGESQGSVLRDEQGGIPGSLVPKQVWKTIDPRVFGMADGVSNRFHQHERKSRIKALGNAVVPQLVYEILRPIYDIEMNIMKGSKAL